MDKITVAFNDNPESEIEKMDGVIMAFSWDAMLPTIGQFVRLRPDEQIDGLLVSNVDIKVKISRKKGRKSRNKTDSNDSQIKML
ncbi:MAG: hypothetical protein ABI366_11050 [Ginsengibacter sp.]